MVFGNQRGLIPRFPLPRSDGAEGLQEPKDRTCLPRILHGLQEMDHRQRGRVSAEGEALIGEGHDLVRAGQEIFRNPLGLLVLADEHGDVPGSESIGHGLTDPCLHPDADRLEAVVGRLLDQHLDLHASGKRLHWRLLHVPVDIGQRGLEI